jgi:hypothetical protein
MDRSQKCTLAPLLAALFAMLSMPSNAESPSVKRGATTAVNPQSPNTTAPTVGVAASIKPRAESGDGANFQPLSAGSELRASQTVRTGPVGQADLVFIDSSNLTVGPGSEVVLDKFVYDPVGSMGQVVVQAPRGEIQLTTGTQDRRAYQLRTPYGTLGVAGND